MRSLEGRVVIFLRIAAAGDVTDVKLHESSGHAILDQAALAFGQTMRFIPAREANQAVASTALYPIRYALVDKQAPNQR